MPTETESAQAGKALSKLALFDGWRPYMLSKLCSHLPKKEVRRYEVLYREGQPANAFYIVLSGHAQVTVERSAQP